MADAIRASLPRSDKPVVAYVSPHAPQATALLTASGVPAFNAPESCAVALDAVRRASAWTAPASTSGAPLVLRRKSAGRDAR